MNCFTQLLYFFVIALYFYISQHYSDYRGMALVDKSTSCVEGATCMKVFITFFIFPHATFHHIWICVVMEKGNCVVDFSFPKSIPRLLTLLWVGNKFHVQFLSLRVQPLFHACIFHVMSTSCSGIVKIRRKGAEI